MWQTGEKKGFGGNKTPYEIVIKRDMNTLKSDEKGMASVLLGSLKTGSKRTKKQIEDKALSIISTLQTLMSTVYDGDLAADNRSEEKFFKRHTTGNILIIAILFVSASFLADMLEKQSEGDLLAIAMAALVAQLVINIVLAQTFYFFARRRLSVKGEELRRYLKGLKLYISVAEAERLQMLQSPDGAEKVGDVTSDASALIKLYERCLPYAMLFGQEKEWYKRLGQLYEEAGTVPSWTGGDAFTAGMYAGLISGVTSSATSAASYSDSSSSFGGSSGGGFSGGGGGGGGGGGW